MDFAKATSFLNGIWDAEIIPALTDYIRIPNKSPAFDPDWEQHGHMEQVVQMFAAWAKVRLSRGEIAPEEDEDAPPEEPGEWRP